MRSQCAEMKRNSCSTQLGKACMQQRRPSAAKKKKTKQNKKETLGAKLVMENAMGWGLGDLSSSLWASLEHL